MGFKNAGCLCVESNYFFFAADGDKRNQLFFSLSSYFIISFLIHMSDPQSRPLAIIIFIRVVCTCIVRPHDSKSSEANLFTTGHTVVWPSGSLRILLTFFAGILLFFSPGFLRWPNTNTNFFYEVKLKTVRRTKSRRENFLYCFLLLPRGVDVNRRTVTTQFCSLLYGDKIWPLYEQLSIVLLTFGHILSNIKTCHNWIHMFQTFSLRFSC